MEYKHFSHPHNKLQIHENAKRGRHCSACETAVSGTAYVCSSDGCSFALHHDCGNAPRGTQHASHPLHHLTLVPYTTYSAGNFTCKACGENGEKGFSYCCPMCDYDLHIRCALLPQLAGHESHPHNLLLAYNSLPATVFNPHQYHLPNNHYAFICGVCNKSMDGSLWSYNCYTCGYHMHASCTLNNQSDQAEDATVVPPEEEVRAGPSGSEGGSDDSALRQHVELQQIQLQLDMSNALAGMMASFNLGSFV